MASSSPRSELLEAIQRADARSVARILGEGPSLRETGVSGSLPLHEAVCTGNRDIVLLLLKSGSDRNGLDAVDGTGHTALSLALQAQFLLDWDKYTTIADLLVEYGAKLGRDLPVPVVHDHDREVKAREFQARRQSAVMLRVKKLLVRILNWAKNKTLTLVMVLHARCPVHGDFLRRGKPRTVPFVVSLPGEYWTAHDSEFPMSNQFALVGCKGDGDNGIETLYCETCRRDEAQWLHGRPEIRQRLCGS